MKTYFSTLTLILIFFLISSSLFSQQYPYFGYAEGVAGETYQMPGKIITAAENDGFGEPGIVHGKYFDIAVETGPEYSSDTGSVFGILPPNPGQTPGDAGGQDIRGYATNDFENSEYYTPLRYNLGGPTLWWRQSGKWAFYTLDFPAGDYNFIYRGEPSGTMIIRIYDYDDFNDPIQILNIDMTSGSYSPETINDNVFNIGGGTERSDWLKILDTVKIETAGRYVIEIDDVEPYANSSWGAFTFNEIIEEVEINVFNGEDWNAFGDTIAAWKYDIAGEELSFANDTGFTVGVPETIPSGTGINIRNYPDSVDYNSILWDTNKQTFQSTGGWYRYTCNFDRTGDAFFLFRGQDLQNENYWNATVKLIDPLTQLVYEEIGFVNGVEKIDPDDNSETPWFYIKAPFKITDVKSYTVEISFPGSGSSGILGAFCFSDENPANLVPRVIQYPWPETADQSEYYDAIVYQNGKAYDLFTHISKPVLEDGPDGNGVTGIFEDRTMSFAQFAFTGEITVKVFKKYGGKAPRVQISPKAYGINPSYFDGDTVVFKLTHNQKGPAYISVNFEIPENQDDQANGHIAVKNGFMLFADKPEVLLPDTTQSGYVKYGPEVTASQVQNADLIYFPPGEHRLKEKFDMGVIRLTKNGQEIYLAGGAYVHGAIHGEGKDNIKIYGRGMFTGREFVFHEIRDENGKKDAFMNFMGSSGCHFEGFIVENPTHHTIPSSNNTYHKNFKIIGWASNHDGIRPSSGSFAEEIFIKTSDDLDYARDEHKVVRSVIWPMRNGAFGQLGWNNLGKGHTTYEDLYFINASWDVDMRQKRNQGVIGSVLNQGVNMANDTVRNIYMEDYTAALVNLSIKYESGDGLNLNNPGTIKNFYFENIKVENGFKLVSGYKMMQPIYGFEQNGVKAMIHDITFVNIVAGNKLVTQENHRDYFYIDDNTTYNINFQTKGEIHTLRTISNSGGSLRPDGDIPVPDGTGQYVYISPNDGYRIKDVLVDNTSIDRVQVVHIPEMTSDHIIEVEFEEGDNYFDLPDVSNPLDYLRDDIDLGDYGTNVEPRKENNITVFPNPASDQLNIQFFNTEEAEIELCSIDGRIIQKRHKDEGKYVERFNTTEIEPGIYLIRIYQNTGFVSSRVIITLN